MAGGLSPKELFNAEAQSALRKNAEKSEERSTTPPFHTEDEAPGVCGT